MGRGAAESLAEIPAPSARSRSLRELAEDIQRAQVTAEWAAEAEGNPSYREALGGLIRSYGAPECGKSRAVFDRGDGWVIKLPVCGLGEYANQVEAEWESEMIPLARCHLEEMRGVEVLVMERVRPVEDFKGLPAWCGWVDSQQVGYDSQGRLVAYDL